MFERRLRILLIFPVLCGLVILARLFQLQIVQGEEYLQLADAALVSPKQLLPPLRGRILDRFGRVLVSDEPAYDVTVHYGVLVMDEPYVLRMAGLLRKREPQWQSASDAELKAEVRRRISRMWIALAEAGGLSLGELGSRRDALCQTIEDLRRHIFSARQRGGSSDRFEKVRLREEDMFHPILRDVTPQARTLIELSLSDLPFVRIEPSVRRVWATEAESLGHMLGRLGQVSPQNIESDPRGSDWLACYRPGDQAGVSGAERLGEEMLRGKRGFEERYLDGTVKASAPPIDGLDVQLTIDLDLQQRIAETLVAAVAESPPSTGASCVVVDVKTRELLALVSVPTYSREQLATNFTALRDDAVRLPLLFRAVQAEYQPGSIIKPVALLAGFANDLVNAGETTFCDGALIPGSDKWHCWTHWRDMPGHGYVDAVGSITHSCNVYFYTLGQRINAQRLTDFYRLFIRGQLGDDAEAQGTGLIEERQGLIPTQTWINERRNRSFRPADGRNYAIGQGEILLTPLQSANMFATLAEGRYRAPTVIANDCRERPTVEFKRVSANTWRLARRGLFQCVNDPEGTAFNYARMDDLEVCGKTGSAQCVPRVVKQRFTFRIGDGETARQLSIAAPTVEAARELLNLPRVAECVDTEILQRYPPPDGENGKTPTHAWFAGFAPYRHPRIALAVMIEYGGSGGRTAGPVGRAIFETIMQSPHDYLPAAGALAVSDDPP